jgi:hypothetical protein
MSRHISRKSYQNRYHLGHFLSITEINIFISNVVIIQGVSEFDRQTCRADSMVKNKHKTLNTHRVKNA